MLDEYLLKEEVKNNIFVSYALIIHKLEIPAKI